jgi:acyl carrier protein
MTTTIEKIKHVLAEIKEEPALAASLTDKSRILDELALDSLQLTILLMKLEDEFEIELDYETFDINHMADVSTLAAFVRAHGRPTETSPC